MRLPFPTRVSLQKTLLFAAAVFVAQLLEHTDPAFSVLFFCYILLSAIAFNIAGGFSRASGTYIFWFASLTCIVGGLWKIVLGEPANTNLLSPSATLATYIVSMATMIAALFISKRIVGKPVGLARLVRADSVNLGVASLGCLLANELATVATWFLPGGSGSISTIIIQLNVFLPLSILLGTIHSIRSSGGRRSVNVISLLAALQIFVFFGLIGYSKQGMFTPIVCWGIAAASQRYRLRLWQIVLLIAFSVYAVMVLSPLSQVARGIVNPYAGFTERLELATDLLSHPVRLRRLYKDAYGTDDNSVAGFAQGYFDTPQGLLDRLNIIKTDDRLVTYTLQGHTVGSFRVFYYFLNWIPHIILPNKESLVPAGVTLPGNYYAHEVGGLLSPDDYSTGISFSPSAEAFHMNMWFGIVLVGGFVWILLFASVDWICGDLRKSPYGLLAMVAFAHVAPESLIGGLVYFIFFQNLGIVVAIFFCSYFAPILGTLLYGSPVTRRYGTRPAPLMVADATP
ncbi:MAG TPA: hypothetical protein VGM11_08620 [Acidobacteriaceae bacterium]|jgi:hypothetical protein